MRLLRSSSIFVVFACMVVHAWAGLRIQKALLVPLDDRPAATQFAQMIGYFAGVTVDTPPGDLLGHFTQPGKCEQINAWLEKNLKNYDALIVDTDMIAYGGLIASRTDKTSFALAVKRIREFWRIRKSCPNLQVYGFSAVMRLAPTATNNSKAWRTNLAKYAELKEVVAKSSDPKQKASLLALEKKIPSAEIERYYSVRQRNNKIQQELLRMTQAGAFTVLALGQDDAKPTGPNVQESIRLREMAKNLNLSSQVLFTDGIDQLANVLLSRALLNAEEWSPKIRVVYADEAGKQKVAFYESETIDANLKDQIIGSGATFAKPGETFDYSLYVNTPDPRNFALDAFLQSMKSEVDQGFPVAIADVNLGKAGTGDPKLFNALTSEGRSSRILSYAGWNTPGNTMGTTIPAANVYMLARRLGTDALKRETALRAFILHRLVNDFEYHKYVRPEAYAMIDKMPNASREETYGSDFEKVDQLVKTDLGERLEHRFNDQLLGTKFFVGTQQFQVTGLRDVNISLPWPRAYEVKLNFKIEVNAVLAPSKDIDFSRFPILPLGGGN